MSYVFEFHRYPTLALQVRWGVEHEQNALMDFLALQNALTSFKVESLDSPYTHPMHFWQLPVMDGFMMSPYQKETRREFWR